MLQRIQSVLLLATAIVSGLLFFMPMAILTTPDLSSFDFYTHEIRQCGEPSIFIAYNWYSMILNIAITALAFITIFLYKKRFLQLRLCVVNIILQAGMLILMGYQIHHMTGEVDADKLYQLSFSFPVIGIILTWLAMRRIIKDIALLKSYDRIR